VDLDLGRQHEVIGIAGIASMAFVLTSACAPA
jgi:hypothetical protein